MARRRSSPWSAIGFGVGVALGFEPLESLFFGAFVSQSSSAVLAKILGDRGEFDSAHGHVALGWATLQDLSTIVLVVLLGALSMGGDIVTDVAFALGKAAIFLAILLPLGIKVLPWLFERVVLLRSREVFILTVVAVALGTAYVSELFGLSLALGAFLAGLLVSESDISHHILGELAPVRDVFAALFFVSVGMFVDPQFVVASVGLILDRRRPDRARQGRADRGHIDARPCPGADGCAGRSPDGSGRRVLIPARAARCRRRRRRRRDVQPDARLGRAQHRRRASAARLAPGVLRAIDLRSGGRGVPVEAATAGSSVQTTSRGHLRLRACRPNRRRRFGAPRLPVRGDRRRPARLPRAASSGE